MSIGPVSFMPPLIPTATTAPTTEEPPPEETIPVAESTGTAETDEESEGSDKMKGVLRNLMAGKFKGVADVRLRINFQAEIAALEEAATQKAAADAIPAFQATVSDAVETTATSELLSEEQAAAVGTLQTDLEAAVSAQADTAVAAEPIDLQAFADQMTATFATFTTALTEALTVEGAVPEDLQALIDDLGSALTQAITDLTTSTESVSALPEISEPSGNGKAFAKFMAQYEALTAEPTADAPTPEPENVETVA